MRDKDFNTGLRGVLFEAKHYARMGAAVWLYGWLVLRQTHQSAGVGYVLGGSPVTYREIEDETGFNRRTLEAWMRVLRREGYIRTQNVPAGISIQILRAKKHRANHGGASQRAVGNGGEARQADLFRGIGGATSFAQAPTHRGVGAVRESAERSPRPGVASGAELAESARITAPMGSSFIERIKEEHENDRKLHWQDSFRGQSFGGSDFGNQENLLLGETKTPNQARTRTQQSRSEEYALKPATPSPSKLQTNSEKYPQHDRFPWELRKRMQMIRAEREEELRRELYVGTGPEGRR
jgi:hypothetical protein